MALRTFIAADIDDGVRRAIDGAQAELKRACERGVSWTRPENLHVTVKFLGDVEALELPALVRAAADAVRELPAFDASAVGLGVFTPRKPKVVWAGVDDPQETMAQAFAAVEAALAPMGFPPETRPFTPHITLGRIRHSHPKALLEEIERRSDTDYGVFPVESLTIYTSLLTRTGPVYSVAGRAAFARG